MSFILDGLKKLEENRNRDSVPNLLTVHTRELQKEEKRPVWPYLILAVLFLNALVLSIWLGIRAPQEEASVKQAETIKEDSNIILKHPVPEAASVNQVQISKQAEIKENIIVKNKESVKTNATGSIENNIAGNLIDIKNTSPTYTYLSEQKDTVEDNLPPEPSDKVFELNELPLNIRQSLPEISISAHIYSNNPSSRVVNINGSITHEGDNVNPDLKVDEITLNGVILKYLGYRFNMKGL